MPEATQCLENATHCKFSNVVSWLFFNWPPRCDLTGKLIKKVIADAQNHGRQCFFIHDHILTYRIARTRVISEGTDNEFIAYEQYTEFQYDVLFSHLKRVSIWCLIYECYNFWQTSKMGSLLFEYNWLCLIQPFSLFLSAVNARKLWQITASMQLKSQCRAQDGM